MWQLLLFLKVVMRGSRWSEGDISIGKSCRVNLSACFSCSDWLVFMALRSYKSPDVNQWVVRLLVIDSEATCNLCDQT
jgi:hypothetical protein